MATIKPSANERRVGTEMRVGITKTEMWVGVISLAIGFAIVFTLLLAKWLGAEWVPVRIGLIN